jgi:dTDP-4-dehydrorhamnose 3,5-epimerase
MAESEAGRLKPNSKIEGVVAHEVRRHEDERGWLSELFRHDELDEEFHPAMAYLSMTKPGVTRGPHEHVDQADLFFFVGWSRFRIDLWDNRHGSASYGTHDCLEAAEGTPLFVLVPKGVVHQYRNVGSREGLVVNCPNRLYAGWGRREAVDEIRHEDDPQSPFRVDETETPDEG